MNTNDSHQPTTCPRCAGRMALPYIVSTSGGTRWFSLAGHKSRGMTCRGCAETKVREMNARDRAAYKQRSN